MPRRRVSENKNGTINTGIEFCSETGKRLDDIRYDTRELIRKSQCKNTWAQGVVKALFETEPKNKNLKHTAESILSNLHSRVSQSADKFENQAYMSGNFHKLEERSKKLKIRKVKKNIESQIDPQLRYAIESILDEKFAQAK